MFRHTLAFAGAAALMVALAACAARPASDLTDGENAQVAAGLSRLRAATRAFHTLDSAVAAGYPRAVPDCLVHEHHGAMGYHHVNRGYLDDQVDVERPEILLYEELPNGDYRLNGVEFIVPYRAWSRASVNPGVNCPDSTRKVYTPFSDPLR